MSKILAIGYTPPHLEKDNRIVAGNYRTWQLIQPLLEEEHEIHLCCASYFSTKKTKNGVQKIKENKCTYYLMNFFKEDQMSILQNIHDSIEPDCILGITQHPAVLASKLVTDKPIWCDLYGHVMAEAQAKAYVYDDDTYLSHFWSSEQPVLLKGDVFSVCGIPQKYALIGELDVMKRLNKYTFSYEFVYPILPGVENRSINHDRNIIRGKFVDDDDFVILWCGGYNTWTDINTLFHAIVGAMRENNKIKFVSVGGQIDGHDDITYNKFLAMIEKSKYSDRFKMMGWRPFSEVHNYYIESNAGINIDKFHYETVLGTRTRLLEMLQAGLPVITSLGCELSYIIKEKNIGLTFPIGDAKFLKNSILKLAKDPNLERYYSTRGKEFVTEELSFKETTKPLRDWIKDPKLAPDKGKISYEQPQPENIDFIEKYGLLKAFILCLKEHGISYTLNKIYKRL